MNPTLMALGVGSLLGMVASAAAAPTCWVYFGTQTTDSRSGLYRSLLNQDTGALSTPERVTTASDSVFMAWAPDHRHLYCLVEVPRAGGHPGEAIETYAVDPQNGALSKVGEQVSDGSEACHISVDPSGRCVLTANYGDHYIEVFPIRPDASVGHRTAKLMFSGRGPNASRQEAAHPHSVNVDPTGKFAVVCDLGQDKIFVYRLDAAHATLAPNTPPFTAVAPGAGPRHFVFHPDGRHAFVINELAASITVLDWDGAKGILTPGMTLPILRADYSGPTNTAAEVVVSKDGNFVYGSNRGDDSLVVSAFDRETGQLTFVQRMTEGVKVPRNYAIDPSGKWLVCANLQADTATVYGVDPQTGRLTYTGSVPVPESLCVRFLAR